MLDALLADLDAAAGAPFGAANAALGDWRPDDAATLGEVYDRVMPACWDEVLDSRGPAETRRSLGILLQGLLMQFRALQRTVRGSPGATLPHDVAETGADTFAAILAAAASSMPPSKSNALTALVERVAATPQIAADDFRTALARLPRG
ncbi:MAG: hypothetical protein KDE27_21705 [Planctomycetes bacterium]|nr:hypothetical protein [Planctomycetota bacterium]